MSRQYASAEALYLRRGVALPTGRRDRPPEDANVEASYRRPGTDQTHPCRTADPEDASAEASCLRQTVGGNGLGLAVVEDASVRALYLRLSDPSSTGPASTHAEVPAQRLRICDTHIQSYPPNCWTEDASAEALCLRPRLLRQVEYASAGASCLRHAERCVADVRPYLKTPARGLRTCDNDLMKSGRPGVQPEDASAGASYLRPVVDQSGWKVPAQGLRTCDASTYRSALHAAEYLCRQILVADVRQVHGGRGRERTHRKPSQLRRLFTWNAEHVGHGRDSAGLRRLRLGRPVVDGVPGYTAPLVELVLADALPREFDEDSRVELRGGGRFGHSSVVASCAIAEQVLPLNPLFRVAQSCKLSEYETGAK